MKIGGKLVAASSPYYILRISSRLTVIANINSMNERTQLLCMTNPSLMWRSSLWMDCQPAVGGEECHTLFPTEDVVDEGVSGKDQSECCGNRKTA